MSFELFYLSSVSVTIVYVVFPNNIAGHDDINATRMSHVIRKRILAPHTVSTCLVLPFRKKKIRSLLEKGCNLMCTGKPSLRELLYFE